MLFTLLLALCLAVSAPPLTAQDAPRAQDDPPPPDRGVAAALAAADAAHAPFVQTIPGTLVTIEMLPVGELWWSRTEITWDAYDVLVFGLDHVTPPGAGDAVPAEASPSPQAPSLSAPSPPRAGPDAAEPETPLVTPRDPSRPGDPARPRDPSRPGENGADGSANEEVRGPDAVLRPTKPHIVTDRGFGHAGYPALSLSARGAQSFCEWLSAVSGRRYRLPTEAEWEAACRANAPPGTAPDAVWSCGDDPAAVPEFAWHRENSERKTHPVGSKAAGALGLQDLHGNVAEWCLAADGTAVLKGGSYRDPVKALRIDARQVPVAAWNQSDPNLPRSKWWLADAPFAGFRIVCEGAASPPAAH